MKRFACYLNPWHDLKVMTVYGTPSDTPHYKRARAGLLLFISIVSVLARMLLLLFR